MRHGFIGVVVGSFREGSSKARFQNNFGQMTKINEEQGSEKGASFQVSNGETEHGEMERAGRVNNIPEEGEPDEDSEATEQEESKEAIESADELSRELDKIKVAMPTMKAYVYCSTGDSVIYVTHCLHNSY